MCQADEVALLCAASSEKNLPSLWERWPSVARTERSLPLPLGEVAERSEDGEGKYDHFKTLSVTYGDSSPRGRAKVAYKQHKE